MREEILKALAYYDVFDFPLKVEELARYVTGDQRALMQALADLMRQGVIGSRDGYYYLFDREYIMPLRQQRAHTAQHKWLVTRQVVRWLAALPYIEAVFASGSLALRNTHELSDLDVLIIARAGRIWTARFLATGLTSLLRRRRRADHELAPDKICLNHYIADRSLLIPESFRNLYNAHTYGNLVPIFAPEAQLAGRFFNENRWLADYHISWRDTYSDERLINPTWWSRLLRTIAETVLNTKFGDYLESWLRRYQIRRIYQHPLTRLSPQGIRICDDYLAFHPESQEQTIISAYQQCLLSLDLDFPDLI